jgi:hypothetical protein
VRCTGIVYHAFRKVKKGEPLPPPPAYPAAGKRNVRRASRKRRRQSRPKRETYLRPRKLSPRRNRREKRAGSSGADGRIPGRVKSRTKNP